MKNLQRILWISTLMGIVVIPAFAGDNDEAFKALDKNEDNKIQLAEYEDCQTMASFNSYDHDADGYISRDEFYKARFDMYDTDKDNMLEGDEMKLYSKQFIRDSISSLAEHKEMKKHEKTEDYGKNKPGMEVSDEDIKKCGDKKLSYDTYLKKAEMVGLFKKWDTNSDGRIDMNEMYLASFHVWDTDESGFIEKDEFASYERVCGAGPETTMK